MSKEMKNKKSIWQQYAVMALSMMSGMLLGAFMALFILGIGVGRSLFEALLMFVILPFAACAALFFHIIVHEAGHLVFGLLTGYKFRSFRIFSFMWIMKDGKLRFKRFSLAGTGGQCLMAPPDMKDGKIPTVLYNLGGSIVNMALGVIFLISFLLCFNIPFLSPLLLIFAAVGFITALSNGIPMRMGDIDNDGYNAIALSKNREALEAFWVQLKVAEQTSMGIRVKDMPPEWFALPSDGAMKNSMVATRGVYACNRLMDEERFEEADALMAHMLDIECGMVGIHRNLLICDRIYVELIGECRPEAIEKMRTKGLKRFMISMKSYPSVLRTEYALALLFENDRAKADKIRSQFEKTAKTYPHPHEIDSERDLMIIADSRIK